MSEQDNKEDELLDKLDGLMRSGRGRRPQNPPPVLTEAIRDPRESAIPTLTDAVETEEAGKQAQLDAGRPDLDKAIASRLVASVDREMANLSKALPEHRYKLAVLHRSIRFALPELVRLRWQEAPADAGDGLGAGDDGATPDTGSDTV